MSERTVEVGAESGALCTGVVAVAEDSGVGDGGVVGEGSGAAAVVGVGNGGVTVEACEGGTAAGVESELQATATIAATATIDKRAMGLARTFMGSP